MTTVADVHAAIRTRLASFTALTVRYRNEDRNLPLSPEGFVFVELIVDDSRIAAYGGGVGQNLHRTDAHIEANLFMPVDTGVAAGFAHAETICALFRSVRADGISYFDAEVYPGAGKSDDGNYEHCATALIRLQFDKNG